MPRHLKWEDKDLIDLFESLFCDKGKKSLGRPKTPLQSGKIHLRCDLCTSAARLGSDNLSTGLPSLGRVTDEFSIDHEHQNFNDDIQHVNRQKLRPRAYSDCGFWSDQEDTLLASKSSQTIKSFICIPCSPQWPPLLY